MCSSKNSSPLTIGSGVDDLYMPENENSFFKTNSIVSIHFGFYIRFVVLSS